MQFTNHLTASRIALELEGLPDEQAWYLVIADRPEEVAAALAEALGARGIALQPLQPDDPLDLLHDPSGLAVVTHAATWNDHDWEELDQLRTAVLRVRPRLIWVAEPDSAQHLLHHAPNFAAFFVPQVGLWSAGPVVEEAPRSAAAPFFAGGLPRPSSPPPPGSYAAQAAGRPDGAWLLFENHQLVDTADRLVDLRRWPRVEGHHYFVIAREALP